MLTGSGDTIVSFRRRCEHGGWCGDRHRDRLGLTQLQAGRRLAQHLFVAARAVRRRQAHRLGQADAEDARQRHLERGARQERAVHHRIAEPARAVRRRHQHLCRRRGRVHGEAARRARDVGAVQIERHIVRRRTFVAGDPEVGRRRSPLRTRSAPSDQDLAVRLDRDPSGLVRRSIGHVGPNDARDTKRRIQRPIGLVARDREVVAGAAEPNSCPSRRSCRPPAMRRRSRSSMGLPKSVVT